MRLRHDERGATAVEFALIVTPLLLSLIGVFEFGRLMWTRNALHGVVAEAARCMGLLAPSCSAGGVYSASGTQEHIRQLARRRAIPLPATGITLSRAATCSGTPGFSRATLNLTFNAGAPLLGAIAGVPLTATACFPNQG